MTFLAYIGHNEVGPCVFCLVWAPQTIDYVGMSIQLCHFIYKSSWWNPTMVGFICRFFWICAVEDSVQTQWRTFVYYRLTVPSVCPYISFPFSLYWDRSYFNCNGGNNPIFNVLMLHSSHAHVHDLHVSRVHRVGGVRIQNDALKIWNNIYYILGWLSLRPTNYLDVDANDVYKL